MESDYRIPYIYISYDNNYNHEKVKKKNTYVGHRCRCQSWEGK